MATLNLLNFSKKLGRLSSVGPEIVAFGSHRLANIQPILDCFIPNFKLKYEDSENIKIYHVNTVNFRYIKSNRAAFLLHSVQSNLGISNTKGINSFVSYGDGLLYPNNY